MFACTDVIPLPPTEPEVGEKHTQGRMWRNFLQLVLYNAAGTGLSREFVIQGEINTMEIYAEALENTGETPLWEKMAQTSGRIRL